MFKCSVLYGYDEMIALNTLLEKTNRKPSIRATRIMLYIMGVLILIAGLIALPTMELSVTAFVPMLGGIGLIYMGRQYVHYNTKNSLKGIERMLGTMDFVFEKKGLKVTDRNNSVVLSYVEFDEIIRYHDMWFIFRNKTRAYILPDSKFYEGDLSELPAFLEMKTGKAPTYIK